MREENNTKIKRCIIITGMSGGGKSSALDILEDQGFYAIDNIPPSMLPQLIKVVADHPSAAEHGVAAVVDVRGATLLKDLSLVVPKIKKDVETFDIIFMDASENSLLRRFETTRRSHPLANGTTILDAISKERESLEQVKRGATVYIDTSDILVNDLRSELLAAAGVEPLIPHLTFSSFGFKYGIPRDADYIFDVRFLPNPNYVKDLKPLSGRDTEIHDYLGQFGEFSAFLEKTEDLIEFILSVYGNTGKTHLHIAIGCTGGRHRSVAIAELLYGVFDERYENVAVRHRDIERVSRF